jgi:hypothetical protein
MARKQARKGIRKVDGYAVVDGERPLEVHVKQADINRGKPSACDCAIAVAIRREHGAKHVRVNATKIYIERSGVLHRYRTPPGIFDQIELFDRTGQMGPGIYTIPPVPESNRLGAEFRGVAGPHARRSPPLKKRDRPVYREGGET